MLSTLEREQIVVALQSWAKFAPDEPVAGFLGQERLFTPWELVEQVTHETADGQALLEILEHGVRRQGLQAVVARLKRQTFPH